MIKENSDTVKKVADTGKKPARIFVVDDDKLVLATLKKGLISYGYDVEAFSDPNLALEAYRQSQPDLALLDVRMPGMTGPELAQEMLKVNFVPIIMLSAYDDRDIVKEAVELGISGYLVKPIMPNQLVPTIEAALARFAEVRALAQNGDKLREGMENNRVISTAIGIIMERSRIDADNAFQKLRNLAREQRRPLRDVATELVDAIQHANMFSTSSHHEFDNLKSVD
jgi:AmiR/NasT family two-component response regulator